MGPSYVYGDFQGDLAVKLIEVFSPLMWNGETDGPVLVSADSLFALPDAQKDALRMVMNGGHAVLVSEVRQEHLDRIHEISNNPPVLALTQTDLAELYVIAQPQGLTRILVVRSVPDDGDASDRDARRRDYAQQVADWFLEQRALRESGLVNTFLMKSTYETTDPGAVLSSGTFPWSYTEIFSMPAYYSGTCTAMKTCTDTVQATIAAWTVHYPWPIPDQPSDYVITRLSGTVNSAGCKLALGSNNRFAGYWLRQFNLGASVADVNWGGYRLRDGARIMDGEYAPLAANPNETYQTGVTFSMSGSGTLGASPKGPSGSVGFSAGVSYSNTKTITFPAVVTTPQIPDQFDPTKALWTYDSWHHVKNNIEPNNHACGGPGLNIGTALPSIIFGGAFSPSQEWVWALKRPVRDALPVANGYSMLPVDFSASLLLGWAFYWQAIGYCNMSAANGSIGRIWQLGGKMIDVVGKTSDPPSSLSSANSWHSNGLSFDSGCGTTTNFGTIPLGNPGSGEQNGSNVGPPYFFGNVRVNIPLAADPRGMTLTGMSPTSGLQGTVVTLTGTALNTVTSVNFGGQPAASMSMEWPLGQEPVLKVTAPMRILPEGIPVNVSVGNAVKTSENFQFTYTN